MRTKRHVHGPAMFTLAAGVAIAAFLAACGGGGGGGKAATPTVPAGAVATTFGGVPGFSIDGSNLVIRSGGTVKRYQGQLHLGLTSVSESQHIKDAICGQGTFNAGGRFVAVTYEAKNDLNLGAAPGTYFNAEAMLQDNTGKSWKSVDATAGSPCAPSANVALAAGLSRPDIAIDAGQTGGSAIVFDVPADASGLVMVWRGASVPIPPAGPAPTPAPAPTDTPTEG